MFISYSGWVGEGGEGILRGIIGKECQFQVNTGDLGGNISVHVYSKTPLLSEIYYSSSSQCLKFLKTIKNFNLYVFQFIVQI